MEKKVLIIDIETTNFINQGGKIVEIGLVELCLYSGNTEILFSEVMHEKGITLDEVQKSWIVGNSDLTVEEIRHSKELSKYKGIIQFIIDSYPLGVTAYNNVFGFGFLEDRGFNFVNKLPCPMILSTNICKIAYKNKIGYKWPTVEEAFNFFFPDENYKEKHRAADDALHEAYIVKKLYDLKKFKIPNAEAVK